jgi:hypothetical protein
MSKRTRIRKQPAQTERAALIAIRNEAKRIGWPLRFATDLDHDANAIAAMLSREPFTWCLRADGTHLGRATDDAVPLHSQLTMRMVAQAFRPDVCYFYVWDGIALHSVYGAEDADKQLTELANKRYQVRARRESTLMPARVADRREADKLAIAWEQRYGEDFVTIDTWAAKVESS